MKLSKGDVALGGPEGSRWTAQVLAPGRQNTRLRWLAGPLCGREALVPNEYLKLGTKKRG